MLIRSRLFHLALPIFFILIMTAVAVNTFNAQALSQSIVISEVAWGGTAASSSDEWIELYNRSCTPIDVTGWMLSATDGTPGITLNGEIDGRSFVLLERSDDSVISDVSAEFFFTDALVNGGESLELRNSDNQLVDTANTSGGSWPAGSGSPGYASMARISPSAADNASGWIDGITTSASGLDANGNPVAGTPGAANSGWSVGGCNSADLNITLTGPETASPGSPVTYTIAITNAGQITATGGVLTSTLPGTFAYLAHTSTSAPSLDYPNIVWQFNDIAPGASLTFNLEVQSPIASHAIAELSATVTSQTPEEDTTNNSDRIQTIIGTPVLINAVHPAAYNDGDEAVALINLSAETIDISDWRLSDSPSGGLTFPAGSLLVPGQEVWISKAEFAFHRHFGFSADFTAETLNQSWPTLSNDGDSVLIYDNNNHLHDTIVYENGDTTRPGWNGAAVRAYRVSNNFAVKGQIFYRKWDPQTGLPVQDSDTQDDWAQDISDPDNGKRIRYPGWNFTQFRQTAQLTTTANITISITPDNAFNTVKEVFDQSQTSLKISVFRFTNYELMLALVDAANRGVSIDLLQEGAPPGGLLDQQRYLCQILETAGGRCWFMINENTSPLLADQRVWDRYRFLHAKYMIIDDARTLISTDNLSPGSMPSDAEDGLTSGRRGVLMVSDSAELVAHLTTIWNEDFAPPTDYDTDCRGTQFGDYHCDIFRWRANDPEFGTNYGEPPTNFIVDSASGGFTYTVRYPTASSFSSTFDIDLQQSPDNSLVQDGGLFGLLSRAGEGDTVFVQQLDERPHWGDATSNPIDDPNLRVEAYLAAARRGANLWIMLDSYFSNDYDPLDPSNNQQTCNYVLAVARSEGLRIRCTLANPTDQGIHNKMVIAEINGDGFVHFGSINGSEQSSKGNRELAITIKSNEAYALLADMFTRDWPHINYLPIVMHEVRGPAQYPLISEIYYNPPGLDDSAEFIQIANPTARPIDLAGWSIGDAVNTGNFEDVKIFPDGSIIQGRDSVVVAFNAVAFSAEFGFRPDYEIVDSDPNVTDLIDDPAYDEAALLRLGNSGDEVILRNRSGAIIDAVSYGTGTIAGVVAVPLTGSAGRSLERHPWWQDTDNGVNDFRENIATPATLPN